MSRIAVGPGRGARAYPPEALPQAVYVGNQGALYNDDRASSEWTHLIEELKRIRDFEDDWDGEGSSAPGPEITDGAISFALALAHCGVPAADCITAGVNGTIYFEWHTPQGYHEAEVYSPCNVESRFVPAGTNDVLIERLPTGDCNFGYEY